MLLRPMHRLDVRVVSLAEFAHHRDRECRSGQALRAGEQSCRVTRGKPREYGCEARGCGGGSSFRREAETRTQAGLVLPGAARGAAHGVNRAVRMLWNSERSVRISDTGTTRLLLHYMHIHLSCYGPANSSKTNPFPTLLYTVHGATATRSNGHAMNARHRKFSRNEGDYRSLFVVLCYNFVVFLCLSWIYNESPNVGIKR